ncbi:hypothetical protein SGRIM128S_01359 [Streptomyces griseomycini]
MDESAAVPCGERPAGVLGRGAGEDRNGGTARIEDALAEPVVAAVEDIGGYGGLVYLRSRDRRSLVLCVVTGVPRSLLSSWWRVPVGGALPMAEAYRRDESLWLPDERATMLRFPQFTAALPYSFASACRPVRVGGEPVGVLVVLRSVAREPVSERTVRAALDGAGRDMEERLAGFARRAPGRTAPDAVAYGIEYDDQPVGVRLPTPPAPAVRVGMVEWDLDSDRWAGDDDALSLLGVARGDFGGTMAEVEARVSPDDLYELRASRRDAAATGQVRSRRFRVLDETAEDGQLRYRPVELWGHVVPAKSTARLLVGALVDAAGGVTAAEAAERLPDGLFSLDQDGRLVYANRRCQELHGLRAARACSVHAFAASGRPPQEVIAHTNRLLAELEAEVFATCCYVELDPRTGRALAVRAGHPPPLLRHPDGRTEALELAGGVMLGVHPDAAYPVTSLALSPGSVLALYTDGLVEMPGSDIETGIRAVRRRLADSRTDSVERLADQLVRTARRTEDRPDDVALLLTAYRGEDGR